MDVEPSYRRALEVSLSAAGVAGASITSCAGLSGGCINDALRIELGNGQRYFVKSSRDAAPDLFEAEAAGLRALRDTNTIRVPQVVAVGVDDAAGRRFLILELIETGRPPRDFETLLGHQLAELHRAPVGDRVGFACDNFLGATPQPNPLAPADQWPQFWAEQRLQPQLDLARRRQLGGAELQRMGEQLKSRLESILRDPEEPPALLHGDLWSGNYLADAIGRPVLIDPACYWGRREAEFGMLTLFGGLGPRFYDAYHEAYPLAPGSQRRIAVYRLHHLLNHLNLFGASYLADCLELMRWLAG
ncbi:MAG: fructosamine kinase family protein [Planctomycetales bacterium]|nr:fructosamine kinase family protein [Planctomycetales bacterium]